MIDNKNNAMFGRLLGRLGCGGLLHFDHSQRHWGEQPVREMEVSIEGEKILSLPITGFDVQRRQDGFATQIIILASEPD